MASYSRDSQPGAQAEHWNCVTFSPARNAVKVVGVGSIASVGGNESRFAVSIFRCDASEIGIWLA